MSFLRRFTALGSIIAFARSPMGQQLISRARRAASDPATRAKASQLFNRVTQQPRGPRV